MAIRCKLFFLTKNYITYFIVHIFIKLLIILFLKLNLYRFFASLPAPIQKIPPFGN